MVVKYAFHPNRILLLRVSHAQPVVMVEYCSARLMLEWELLKLACGISRCNLQMLALLAFITAYYHVFKIEFTGSI